MSHSFNEVALYMGIQIAHNQANLVYLGVTHNAMNQHLS